MLSVIIPFGLSLERAFIKERIEWKAKFYKSEKELEFIFVEGFSSIFCPKLKELIINQGHIYIKDESQNSFSQGKCRNLGAKRARFEALFFLDADCYLSHLSFQRLLNLIKLKQISQLENAFLMLPCLYLNKEASEILSKKDESLWESLALLDLHKDKKELILNFALASSLIALNKKAFLSLNGFDESFIGHGYEDFEFVLRFLKKYVCFEKLPSNLEFDSRNWEFKAFEGFRALFSLLGLEGVFYGLYPLHFWHENPNQNGYLDNKEKNHALFYKELKNTKMLLQKNPQKSFIGLNSIVYKPYLCEQRHFSFLKARLSHTKIYRLFVKFKKDPKGFFKDSKNPFFKFFLKAK